MMRSALIIFTALFAAPAVASECDALVAQVIERSGAAAVKFPSEHHAVLRDGDLSIDVGCRDRSLKIETPTQFPSSRFFSLAGQIGGLLTGAPAASIEATARKCQQRAMKGMGGAMEETPKAYVDCLFQRGAAAYVSILPRR